MTTPPPTCSILPRKRRVFDLLVIVVIACGLLGLAWRVTRDSGRADQAPRGSLSSTGRQMPDSPELQLLLPLEKFGMVLTRQHVEGNSEQALAVLDQRCREVLASADDWVLSLAVSPEEQQLLDSLVGTEPLSDTETSPRVVVVSENERSFAEQKTTLPGHAAWLFPLTRPTGRAGVRGDVLRGAPLIPAFSPPVESSPKAEPNGGEREPSLLADIGTGAATGLRLICWGFIVSEGAGGNTVWFAQPREKLPRSVSREGHAP